ncbi:MAG: GntR family transcriptional regulator [Helcococcus sp.]|nr:GntR family transcriptional regulator [Helcococcus sp.]
MTLYHELLNTLIEKIKTMNLGDRLPSERQLCVDYDVSRTTVRSAISELELEGYIVRVQGKGTFVSKPKTKKLNLSNYYSFTEQTISLGKVPKTIILDYDIRIPSNNILKKMKLPKGSKIIYMIRLRMADDEKMMLEYTHIPYESFKDITKEILEERPLYEIFEKKYDNLIYKVEESFSVTSVSAYQATTLDVIKASPALKIDRLSYNKNGEIIEYSISIANGFKFNYETVYYPN